MKIRKGDEVKILLGKDRDKEGKVQYVLAKEGKVFVEGANIYKRHIRKQGDREGGIIDLPKPMDISNVALICPNCRKVTRVGYKRMGNEKVRICKKCGKEIK
ncbi:50S ribosomal protein L24 [Candidatus Microgenomates bacterium]|nr:50S ribosomal protein L24 [Candidatus Microgenomates bacterium]